MKKILVINCGSSSIKYQLFRMPSGQVLAKGLVERIGENDGAAADHREAFARLVETLTGGKAAPLRSFDEIAAVGHRVVHGGERFEESVVIDKEVLATVRELVDLAPLHNPPNLVGIEEARAVLPAVPHVAVFDTAFHGTLPPHAYHYAIPHELYERHRVRRYGFHGTSHRYVALRAAELLGLAPGALDAITVHLGNGCSMAAVKGGKSIDTSMGLTPLEGLVMGTRSGDIDPGAVFFLMEKEGLDLAGVNCLLNKRSGLAGLSGVSNDMRELHEAARAGDARARLAIDAFAYRVKKYIGAYLAALGGPPGGGGARAVVFTGGIGENDAEVRAKALAGLAPLGIELDEARNAGARGTEARITTDASPVAALAVPTNEELMIARDTYALVGGEGKGEETP